MQYISTRGQVPAVSFPLQSRKVSRLMAGFTCQRNSPILSHTRPSGQNSSYAELCEAFFAIFATDIDSAELKEVVASSYTKFDHADIAPIVKLDDNRYVLELFHGPTLAFKDFALQLLGNLYESQIARTRSRISVLGATSGDTGAAAIHGRLGKEGVTTFILYPDGRISPLQERQMTCTGAGNVFPLAIKGSFDDAQTAMKTVFEDREFAAEVGLSAVMSFNRARILAQAHLSAYFRLPEDVRDIFVVPRAWQRPCWYVQRMGLPIMVFRVATNQNDILHRLFQADFNRRRMPPASPFHGYTSLPNFERFLYHVEGGPQKFISSRPERRANTFSNRCSGSPVHEATTPGSTNN